MLAANQGSFCATSEAVGGDKKGKIRRSRSDSTIATDLFESSPVQSAILRYALLICIFVSGSTCANCNAQWSALTQRDLRDFTEKALADKLVDVEPPKIGVRTVAPNWRRLVVDLGYYSPEDLSLDPLMNRVLHAQFRVSIIRKYRSQPRMRNAWKPTLAAVEEQIAQMLEIIAAPNLTSNGKHQALDEMNDTIEGIYEQHFVRAANQDGLNDWGYITKARARVYSVTLVPIPDGIVAHMAAGPWEWYLFATRTKGLKNLDHPPWETHASKQLYLSGKYWFRVHFNDRPRPVVMTPGPITIDADVELELTPQGLRRR